MAKQYRKICGHCGNKFKGGKLAKYCSVSHKQLQYKSIKEISQRTLIKESLVIALSDYKGKVSVREYVDICLWVWGGLKKFVK